MESNPVCRLDDFINEAQWKKIQWLKDLQAKWDCPVLNAGDLFDHWKPSPELLAKAIQYIPDQFYSICGQHDLPQHSLELIQKSGIYVLEKANKIQLLKGVHWGQNIDFETSIEGEPSYIYHNPYRRILVWHTHVYQGKLPWPDCPSPSALKVLKKYPKFDLILTGDNHKAFVESYEDRLLVNPGSLFRTTADQITHEPRIYLWYAETNTVEPVYVPIEAGVISREHLEKAKERNDRIEAFISRLDNDWDAAIGFEENLKRFLQKNEIRQSVKDIINKCLEE
jgi:DNA repair exonuclease SbcCD nuclease subunit